jgi:hypothetical protein
MVLAKLTAAGCRVTLRPDGRLSLQPPPPLDLLVLAKQHRDDLVMLVAATTSASAVAPSAEAVAPVAEATPKPRITRPGVCPGDPPAPVVDPEATRTLVVLELAGAGPHPTPDGRLALAHPERVTPEERATAQRYAGDIAALLAYRARLEQLWPVTAEPLPPPA